MAGSSTAEVVDAPAFYYDLASPEAYLAAERVVDVLGTVPEFVPVRLGPHRRLPLRRGGGDLQGRRRAARGGATACCRVRWPPALPADTEWAMLVATYAKQTGRVVAYSMAAFRQAFAAGRDLGERDSVLIAAAAAEMHPAAVIKGAALRGTRRRLDEATAAAAAAGVRDVPAVRIGDAVFHGDRELEARRAALAARGVKANRSYELIVRRGGRGPAALARSRARRPGRDRRDRDRRGRAVLGHRAGPDAAPLARAQDRPRAARRRRVRPPLAALGAGLKRPAGRCRIREQRDSSPPLAEGSGAPLSSSPRRRRCVCWGAGRLGRPAPPHTPSPPPALQ